MFSLSCMSRLHSLGPDAVYPGIYQITECHIPEYRNIKVVKGLTPAFFAGWEPEVGNGNNEVY